MSITRAAASIVLLLALLIPGVPMAAERTDYGELWRSLSGPEREVLLIGYARGVKSAGFWIGNTLLNDPNCSPETRNRLYALLTEFSNGIETSEDLRRVGICLDDLYRDRDNRYLDWTRLVEVARAKMAGTSKADLDREIVRQRELSDRLELLKAGPANPPAPATAP